MTPVNENDFLDVTFSVKVFGTILTNLFAAFLTIVDRAFIIFAVR